MNFKEKVIKIVKEIPPGKFLTYKEVAKKAGNEKAARAVGNILKKSKNIPCHRVIRSDNLVGGYKGREDLSWLKAGLLLKEGAVGVIPTDTIYGICTSAINQKSVERVYKLKKRNLNKPFIILISDINDLKNYFGYNLRKDIKPEIFNLLKNIWPSKISIILPCPFENLSYLHRGTKALAFRLPKDKFILKILKVSGPLIAPSANLQNHKPAKNIKEAKKYFGNKVFYLEHPKWKKRKVIASTLIDVTSGEIKVLRKGADFLKVIKK